MSRRKVSKEPRWRLGRSGERSAKVVQGGSRGPGERPQIAGLGKFSTGVTNLASIKDHLKDFGR